MSLCSTPASGMERTIPVLGYATLKVVSQSSDMMSSIWASTSRSAVCQSISQLIDQVPISASTQPCRLALSMRGALQARSASVAIDKVWFAARAWARSQCGMFDSHCCASSIRTRADRAALPSITGIATRRREGDMVGVEVLLSAFLVKLVASSCCNTGDSTSAFQNGPLEWHRHIVSHSFTMLFVRVSESGASAHTHRR